MKTTSIFSRTLAILIVMSVLLPISCLAQSSDQVDVALRQLRVLHNLPPEGEELENLKAKLLEIHNNGFEDPEYTRYSKSIQLSQIEEEIK